MIKKISIFLLIVTVLLCLTGCGDNGNTPSGSENNIGGSSAPTGTVNATPSEGLEYTISYDETYYIVSGIGECKDNDVVIPSVYQSLPVREIGERAFNYRKSLTSVTIPDSVVSIESFAFANCSGLTSVAIPNSVTNIGGWAFYDCSNLASITIPDSGVSIGSSAFQGCIWLKELTVPASVTSVGSNAFKGCKRLKSVTWNAENCTTSYLSYLYPIFDDCTLLSSVTIGENVETIPPYTFADCTSLTSVTWNAKKCTSASDLYYPLFSGCTALTSITIGEEVETIPPYAFSGCSALTSVMIPGSVVSIGTGAFYHCSNLTSVAFENTEGWYYSTSAIDVTDPEINAANLTEDYIPLERH